jgi:hypothetical protein
MSEDVMLLLHRGTKDTSGTAYLKPLINETSRMEYPCASRSR